MNKLEYLIHALNNRYYQRKSWIISAFSLVISGINNEKSAKFCIQRDLDKKEIFFINEDNTRIVITPSDFEKELFSPNDKVTLPKGCHPFITEDITTTLGVILLNFILIWEPFKGKVPYQNKLFTGKLLKSIIREQMVDNPKPGETVPEGKSSVDDCLKVSTQADYLEGVADIFVKTAAIDALTVDKSIIELKDRLIKDLTPEEKKDPVVMANIIDTVVEADAQIQLNGKSKEFFIEKGLIDNARKKMFLVFGMEQDFVTGEYVFIEKPLVDGWDLNYLPLYINTAVTASFDRGKDTADGGARVKEIIRHTSDIVISEDDCGTNHTEDIKLTKDIFKDWIGAYHMVNGKPTLITDKDTGLIDKVVKMRVPNYCKTKDRNYCKVCCGVQLSENPKGLNFECFHIGTVFMLLSMKGAHVSQLHTSTVDLDIAFC